ncbi:MAG: hypothetical protein WD049_06725 [Candidatus Paceibacterota bacterium]
MSNGGYDDSGHRALVGFFYQSVSTAGWLVELEEGLQRDDDNDGHESLFAVVRPEEQGQDAFGAASDGESAVFKVVQHKFSETPDTHPIEPKELFDILTKLEEAAERIRGKHGVVPVCCLHTNRPLSTYSAHYLNAARNDEPDKGLDETVETKDKNSKTLHKGRTLEKNKLYREWLAKLDYEVRSFDVAKASFRGRAAGFGVLPTEIEARLPTIEGEFFATASRNTARQVTLSDLDRWLTMDDLPRKLCSQDNADAIRDDLRHQSQYILQPEPLLHRGASAELLRKSGEYPIVQVYGEGGAGKSVLVYQHLLAMTSTPPPFIGASDSRLQLDFWAGELFVGWRNSRDENLRKESLERIVARLEIASSDKRRPLLVLFLDGIDERDSDQLVLAIRKLDKWLRAERERCIKEGDLPRVQLFVTCRDPLAWSDLIGIDNPFADAQLDVHCIKMEMLEAHDLRRMPADFLPKSVVDRIQTALSQPSADDVLGADDDTRYSPTTSAAATFGIMAAIQHPPFVAALRRLPPDVSERVFDGDPVAQREAAKKYVEWFSSKVVRRRQFPAKSLVTSLLAIVTAHSTDAKQIFDYESGWKSPLLASGEAAMTANQLFQEAISAGIVRVEAQKKWRWRNEFVCLGIDASDESTTEV